MRFTKRNGNTSNSKALIDKVSNESLEIYENLPNITRFTLRLFYEVSMCNGYIGVLDQYPRAIWCNFQRRNIRNVWQAWADGHHYDITSEWCGVIKFSWVDAGVYGDKYYLLFSRTLRLLTIINIKWDKNKKTLAVGIVQLTHYSVRGRANISRPLVSVGSFASTASLIVI